MAFRNQNRNNRNFGGGNNYGPMGGNRGMGGGNNMMSPWENQNSGGGFGGGNMRQGGGGGGGGQMNAQAINLANNLLNNLFRNQNPPSLLDMPRGGNMNRGAQRSGPVCI